MKAGPCIHNQQQTSGGMYCSFSTYSSYPLQSSGFFYSTSYKILKLRLVELLGNIFYLDLSCTTEKRRTFFIEPRRFVSGNSHIIQPDLSDWEKGRSGKAVGNQPRQRLNDYHPRRFREGMVYRSRRCKQRTIRSLKSEAISTSLNAV